MDTSIFQAARLIPVTGIKGAQDQERRASSALLAVMQGVPELAYVLLKPLGAPKGVVKTYIEPEFKLQSRKVRPDGLIEISRGGKVWTALVEFKTGQNDLDLGQINDYLDVAKAESVDALITISNQVLDSTGLHPTKGIDNRRLKGTKLTHFSWMSVISECIILSEHTKVADPERAWILSELIRFLQSDASGASEFNDMGSNWVEVRDGVKTGAIRKADEAVLDVVSKFQNLSRYCAFTLAARLGVSAEVVVPKIAMTDGKKYLLSTAQDFISTKTLSSKLRIPGAAALLEIQVDMASGMTHCYFDIEAPTEGRNKSRLNWLLRQLKNIPAGSRVSFLYKRARNFEAPLDLPAISDGKLDVSFDGDKEIAVFRVELVRQSGAKRGRGQSTFIDVTMEVVENCYQGLLQPIKPWRASAPKLSEKVTDLIPEEVDA